MRFAWWQIVGMIGDQFEWWGQSLQRRSAHHVRKIIGVTAEDDDQARIRKLLDYVYPSKPSGPEELSGYCGGCGDPASKHEGSFCTAHYSKDQVS